MPTPPEAGQLLSLCWELMASRRGMQGQTVRPSSPSGSQATISNGQHGQRFSSPHATSTCPSGVATDKLRITCTKMPRAIFLQIQLFRRMGVIRILRTQRSFREKFFSGKKQTHQCTGHQSEHRVHLPWDRHGLLWSPIFLSGQGQTSVSRCRQL